MQWCSAWGWNFSCCNVITVKNPRLSTDSRLCHVTSAPPPWFSPNKFPLLHSQRAFRSPALPMTDVLESAPLERVSFPSRPQEGVFSSVISAEERPSQFWRNKKCQMWADLTGKVHECIVLFLFDDAFFKVAKYATHKIHQSPRLSRDLGSQPLFHNFFFFSGDRRKFLNFFMLHSMQSHVPNEAFGELMKETLQCVKGRQELWTLDIQYPTRRELLWFRLVLQDGLRFSSYKEDGSRTQRSKVS